MIKITDKTKCCGCGACAQICPRNAIAMQADNEGFLYPTVDESKCIKCGLCLKSCPILNNKKQQITPEVYVAKNKNIEEQKQSSSGGMFSVLANYVLEQKGIVFGAAFDRNWKVEHCFINKKEDLDKLRRSKYVQSNTLETFREAKKFLESGKHVLYTGTPCQIAGLKSFLSKDYDNLLTVDIICHSTPSPKVWQDFLAQNYDTSKLIKIDFRDKKDGWNKSELRFYFKDRKDYIANKQPALFVKGFIFGLFSRPSCYNCYFKYFNRFSDFTIGDAWGYDHYAPEMFDKNGLSVIFINNKKAKEVFNKLKMNLNYKQELLKTIIEYNPRYQSSIKQDKKRSRFFGRYQNEDINKLIRELTYRPLSKRALGFIKRMCKKVIKI